MSEQTGRPVNEGKESKAPESAAPGGCCSAFSSLAGFALIIYLFLGGGAAPLPATEPGGIIPGSSNIIQEEPPLKKAVWEEDATAVFNLLEKGADPNVKMVPAYRYGGNSLLHMAVMKKNTEIAWLLLEKGANPNAKNEHSFTPLHEAAESGLTEIVSMLIEKGADFDARSIGGSTPLKMAEDQHHGAVATLLREAMAKQGIAVPPPVNKMSARAPGLRF